MNVQLIDAESGSHVWSERYDRAVENVFVVQDEIIHRGGARDQSGDLSC